MNKKIITLGLTVLGLVTSCFAEDIVTYTGLIDGNQKINNINYSDVLSEGENYWAKPAIYQVAAMNIMNGVAATTFSPTASVTNEQAITTLLNATGKSEEVENQKMLVKNWSDKYIKYAMNNGLITEKIVYKKDDVIGDIKALKDKGVFIRDLPITREEMATLIYRALSLSAQADTTKTPVEFLDKALIEKERISHVDAVSMAGIMVGNEEKMFNPKSGLTRAELAQILKNCESYIIDSLRLIKFNGFIDSTSGTLLQVTDDIGNEIHINCLNTNIPVIRKNTLLGVSGLKNSDEIEFFVNSSKQVVFIRVIDEGIYENSSNNGDSLSKQGIVLGNSPYFYQISIKDKNGNVENYEYGRWTEIYKDGKETNAGDILQGDTVYLEFDEIGDLVVIRGVTNTVITYGTIIEIDDFDITISLDSNNLIKTYDLRRIPVYKNGIEVEIDELKNGEYAKIHSSQSEIIKLEIVHDERTVENLYKGYISEINLIQDKLILRNPKVLKNDEWVTADSRFITISLDKNMNVFYDDIKISKSELGQKQVGKFAYVATREDTQVLEKVKSLNIELEEDTDTIIGEIRSYNSDNGLLRIYDSSKKLYVDENSICVSNGKIVNNPLFEKGSNVSVTVSYQDGKYFVKLITEVEKLEEKEVEVYYGMINNVDKGEELSVELVGKFIDDEWEEVKRRNASFNITNDTRIYSETEPLNISELDSNYEDKMVCIVSYDDDAVLIGIMDLGEIPYVSIGSIEKVDSSSIKICDVEYYDLEEEEWVEGEDETILTVVNTLITKNGNFARFNEIEKDFEVTVIRATNTSPAGVILMVD